MIRHLSKFAIVVTLSGMSLSAFAASCETSISSNDAMQFNTKEIVVPKSCKSFKINLKHTGKLPKTAMGHNIVISKTSDMDAVSKAGIAAGVANNYVKAGDPRVVAYTKLIGGGESTSVSFPVAKLGAGQGYSFFCSFPGHSSMMKGTIKVK